MEKYDIKVGKPKYYYINKSNKDDIKRIIREIEDANIKLKTVKKLREVYLLRKKRNIKAAVLIASFILCFELSLFVITDVIELAPIYAMIFGIIGTACLAYGVYLIIHNPPIYVE